MHVDGKGGDKNDENLVSAKITCRRGKLIKEKLHHEIQIKLQIRKNVHYTNVISQLEVQNYWLAVLYERSIIHEIAQVTQYMDMQAVFMDHASI